MRIIDISGSIENGMWSYADPYPEPRIKEISDPNPEKTISAVVVTFFALQSYDKLY